jgi:fumarate reductase flavoprotein subunit
LTSEAIISATNDALAEAAGIEIERPALIMTAGTFDSQAKGMFGSIAVEVEVSEDAILSVKVTDNIPREDPCIEAYSGVYEALSDGNVNWFTSQFRGTLLDTSFVLETAASRLPERIVANQSLAVDAVAGATASSSAIISAVKDCVVQAGGDPAALNIPVVKVEASEEYDCDILVVGGGTSGCSAASKAAESGKKVLLMEKSGRIGGTGAFSFMPFSTNSSICLEAGINIDESLIYDGMMSGTHWVADGKVLNHFIHESGETTDWMISKGFNYVFPTKDHVFTTVFGAGQTDAVDPNVFTFVEYGVERMFSEEVMDLFRSLTKDIDTILYETSAKSLIMNDDGSVAGVMAERYDGTSVKVNAKAVVVATGGFAGSLELQQKYQGAYYRPFGLYQNVGDGLNMMLDAGAAERNIGGFVSHVFGSYAKIEDPAISVMDRAIPITIASCPTFLRVSPYGERFMDENKRRSVLQAAANAQLAAGPYFYSIVSGKQAEELKTGGCAATGMDLPTLDQSIPEPPLATDYIMTNFDAVMAAGELVGEVYSGSTIQELAEAAGMNPGTLAETIKTYNELCAAGEDTQYLKEPQYLDALGEEGPWYAIKTCPTPYSTLGGVGVTESMEVIDAEGDIIPGLYAVGVDSIGTIMDGVQYPAAEGITLGWGFNSGRFAGESAAAFV